MVELISNFCMSPAKILVYTRYLGLYKVYLGKKAKLNIKRAT